MAWSLLGHTSAGTNGALTTPAINSSGAALLIAAVSRYQSNYTGITLTDSAGNTWTAAEIVESGNPNAGIGIWYVLSPATSASHTLTLSSGNYQSVVFEAFGGVSSPTFDRANGAGSGSSVTSQQPGSITPAANGELVISALGWQSSAAPSIDSGFTINDSRPQVGGASFGVAAASLVQATAAAIDPTWSWSTAAEAAAAIVAFRAAPAAAPYPFRRNRTWLGR